MSIHHANPPIRRSALDRRERAPKPTILSHEAYLRAVTLRDLTDPAQGPHALQLLLDRIQHALRERWGCEVRVHRAHPAVPVEHNYTCWCASSSATWCARSPARKPTPCATPSTRRCYASLHEGSAWQWATAAA